MSHEVMLEEGEGFIRVRVYGHRLKSDILQVEGEVLALHEQTGIVKLLIDRRDLQSLLGTLDLYEIGNRIPQSKFRRIGIIVNAITEEYRFLETVVANRGGNLRSFTSEKVALAWLSGLAVDVEHQGTNNGK